ncbi:hypothetical protein NUW54_g1350 [Trametes sanguinea]|uniref:Uncharacterized protein n=1 Tax=Trametes sanguinea TaxID=158606 RepID=A0ACC1Q8G5_9APHY|nr:hypothetical protein NUW54_g1350 [Trametes sanguinea]
MANREDSYRRKKAFPSDAPRAGLSFRCICPPALCKTRGEPLEDNQWLRCLTNAILFRDCSRCKADMFMHDEAASGAGKAAPPGMIEVATSTDASISRRV